MMGPLKVSFSGMFEGYWNRSIFLTYLAIYVYPSIGVLCPINSVKVMFIRV